MGMAIDEHIAQLKKLKSFHNGSYGASINFALETMRKYQQIQEILNNASYTENGTVYSYIYDEDTRVKHIRQVVEDGNND